MRAALYLRRSTNEVLQADSLIAQEAALRRFAADHGHTVIAVYADSASGRNDDRPEFQRLMHDVEHGAAFEAILVTTISRWGRWDDPDAAAFWEYLCMVRGGVRVIYALEDLGPAESPITPLQKTMKRWLAAEFSRDRSRIVRRSQARVVELGFMHGGPPPFGLRRILVDRGGTYISELHNGDRKALSNLRVKLAPGDPEQVEVVRNIFRWYVDDGLSLKEIADELGRRGVRGRDGGMWRAAGVAYVLRNPVYAGYSRYTTRKSSARPQVSNDELNRVLTPDAFEALVARDTWERAQAKLGTKTWRKTNLDLARELRLAYERWGCVEASMLNALDDHACFDTYANRFRNGYPEALEVAYANEVNDAKESLLAMIEAHFDVASFEGGWMLDTLLHVGFKVAWPRARWGDLYWEWNFEGDELEDITIALAFTPPPVVKVVDVFLLQTGKFRVRKQSVRRKLMAKKPPNRFVLSDSPDRLIRYLRNAIFFRNVRAEKQLMQAVADSSLVNVAEVARKLGWPEHATRVIYEKLLLRGVVPPMRNRRGRRVEVVCPECKGVRRLLPMAALALRSDVCYECQCRRPNTKKKVKCPQCGAARVRMPSQISVMKEGDNSLCHACAMAKGRRIRSEWLAARRPIEQAKQAALRRVAILTVAEMNLHPDQFITPVVWSRGRRRFPTLRWRDATSGARVRLTVTCSDEIVNSVAAEPGAFTGAVLDRERWSRSDRCDGRNDEAWAVTLE